MNLLCTDNYTLQKITKQLKTKYCYLRNQKHSIIDIIKKWLVQYDFNIVNSLKSLEESISLALPNNLNVEDILLTITIPEHKKKYQIFHNHQFEDFALIRFAADFYGTDISQLATDAKEICNTNNSIFTKIDNTNIRNEIVHLVMFDILVLFGILFYYLEIADTIKNIHRSNIDKLGLMMVKNLKKKKLITFEELMEKKKISSFLSRKKLDVINVRQLGRVYHLYQKMVRYVARLNTSNGIFREYCNNYSDYELFLNKASDDDNKKLLFDKYYFLMFVSGIYKKHLTSGESPCITLIINVKHFESKKLLVEI